MQRRPVIFRTKHRGTEKKKRDSICLLSASPAPLRETPSVVCPRLGSRSKNLSQRRGLAERRERREKEREDRERSTTESLPW
jgi:hypothetical protein